MKQGSNAKPKQSRKPKNVVEEDLDDLDDLMGGDARGDSQQIDEDDFFGGGKNDDDDEFSMPSKKKKKGDGDPLAFLQRAQFEK